MLTAVIASVVILAPIVIVIVSTILEVRRDMDKSRGWKPSQQAPVGSPVDTEKEKHVDNAEVSGSLDMNDHGFSDRALDVFSFLIGLAILVVPVYLLGEWIGVWDWLVECVKDAIGWVGRAWRGG